MTRQTTYGTKKGSALGTKVFAALLFVAGATGAGGNELSDQTICDAVGEAYFTDSAVPFDSVNVQCNEGIITLTGKTSHLLAKERATRLAETVKGVRSIVNRIQVKPPKARSKSEIRAAVSSALLSDPATDSFEIDVAVSEKGKVTLSGTVDSWPEKNLAETVAIGVRGVTGVVNEIDVDFVTDRPDREIEPDIEQSLKWNALVNDALIDVDVANGKVTLSGTVGSLAEKRRARYDAWVAGVRMVDDSDLKVHDWAKSPNRRETEYPTKTAGAVKDAINDALLYDPRVSSFSITPHVTGSIVTLRGTVDNAKAKQAAAENARNTVGVSRVANRIRVQPNGARSDAHVEADVSAALVRDPFVERYEIDVDCNNGVVALSGYVDSYFEKAQAEDAAMRVNGVVDVSNALVISAINRPVVHNPYVYDWYIYDYDWYDFAPSYTAKSDTAIADAINNELWWSPFVDADEVTVEVEDGVASLTGTVDSWAEYHAAAENSLEGGAIAVDNNLIVRHQ